MTARHLVWIPAVSPWAALGALITLALHVRLGLGHWPKPMHETYETAWYTAHGGTVIVLFLFALVAAPILWMASCRFERLRATERARYVQLAAFGLGWLLFYIYVKIDPGSFVLWFLD